MNDAGSAVPAPRLPASLAELRAALERGESFRYRHFWGHRPRADGALSDGVFSQWWRCRFELEGQAYGSAEQFMMAEKARMFGDAEARKRILAADDPASCKALGRKVRGFDPERWSASAFDLVTRGNVAKFGQDGALRGYLEATGSDLLVEASPVDRIWGIGLGRDDPRADEPRAWEGENLLGFALVRARAILRGESPPPA